MVKSTKEHFQRNNVLYLVIYLFYTMIAGSSSSVALRS